MMSKRVPDRGLEALRYSAYITLIVPYRSVKPDPPSPL